MKIYIVFGVAFWLACAALSYAVDFAYFQAKFPTIAKKRLRKDAGEAMICGLAFGPLGLLLAFFWSGFAEDGLKWRIK